MIIQTNHELHHRIPKGAVVMLGYFDGFHRGHMALAEAAFEIKRQKNAPCVMLWTFTRLNKGKTITDNDEKAEAFFSYSASHGDAAIVFEDFSAISHLTGEEFVRDVLWGQFCAAAVVCGFNFRFGVRGSSGSNDLQRYCRDIGMDCCVVPSVSAEGDPISSTRLRRLLEEGAVDLAAEWMTRPYTIRGPVVHGKRLGRTLGFPTVNLRIPDDKVTPRFGVYACRVRLPNGSQRNGVCNIGSRPTVNSDGGDVTMETYIFDFAGDLYGEQIAVSLLKKLRDEVRFSSKEALSLQIAADKVQAMQYFMEECD